MPTDASPYARKKTVTDGVELELKMIPGGETVKPYSPLCGLIVIMRESPMARGTPFSDSIDPDGNSISRKVVLKLSECSTRSIVLRVFEIQKLRGVTLGAPARNDRTMRSASDLLVSTGRVRSEQEEKNSVKARLAAIPRLRDIGRQ